MNWTAAFVALMGGVRAPAHIPFAKRRQRISRVDAEMLSEDRKRDLGLLDGRRPRGECCDARGVRSAR
jgi:hypothetical protein